MNRFGLRVSLLISVLLAAPAHACPVSAPDIIRSDSFESCARTQSGLQRLADDLMINGIQPTVVLTRSITVDAPTRVLVVADGRHFPVDAPAAVVRVRIDGDESASSVSVTDWGSSQRPMMHAFNVLADASLGAGTHQIELIAHAHSSRPGRFRLGAGSAMSVLVQPLSTLSSASLPGATGAVNLITFAPGQGIDVLEGGIGRPLVPVLAHSLRNPGARALMAITLASGRAYHVCNSNIDEGYGDALLGLTSNGVCQNTQESSWSVNDIDPNAEKQAPLMLHGAHSLQPGQERRLDLVVSELAFGSDQPNAHENGVCWSLGSTRMLTALNGAVSGAAIVPTTAQCSTYTWQCVASTAGTPGCPVSGTDVVLASAWVQIPPGHDGIVLFNARARIQGDNADALTTATLSIRVDGAMQGAIGMQQLADGAAAASRTLSASYLSAANAPGGRLSVGPHLVEVTINVSGSRVAHASVPTELALTWFD